MAEDRGSPTVHAAARTPHGFSRHRLRRLEYAVVVSLVLFVTAMVAVSLYAGVGEVARELAKLSPGLVVGLLGLSLVNYALRAWRWHLYCRHLALRIPPALNVLHFVAGFALTTTPGKVGEGLRLWLIERCHGYRYEQTVPLFLGDRLADMNAVVLLCLVGLIGFPDRIWATAIAATGMLLLSLLLAYPRPLIAAVGRAYAAGGGRGRRFFARLRAGLRRTAGLFAPSLLGPALVLSIVGWFAEGFAFHWLLDALGAPLTQLQALFVFTFAIIVGAVSMLPGGLGSAEATMVGLLLAMSVELETAVAATVIIRATTLWFGVVLGFITLPAALRLARTRRGDGAAVSA